MVSVAEGVQPVECLGDRGMRATHHDADGLMDRGLVGEAEGEAVREALAFDQQAGIGDGDTGGFGEQFPDADRVPGERVGVAGVDVQGSDEGVGGDQGQRQGALYAEAAGFGAEAGSA